MDIYGVEMLPNRKYIAHCPYRDGLLELVHSFVHTNVFPHYNIVCNKKKTVKMGWKNIFFCVCLARDSNISRGLFDAFS